MLRSFHKDKLKHRLGHGLGAGGELFISDIHISDALLKPCFIYVGKQAVSSPEQDHRT